MALAGQETLLLANVEIRWHLRDKVLCFLKILAFFWSLAFGVGGNQNNQIEEKKVLFCLG